MTQFRIVVIVDPTRAVTGTRAVRKELITLSAAARRANFELLRAFSIFAGIQVITSAVRTMSEFSLAMATVEAVSQATGNEIQILTERAQELGATTRFTATQAAQGMEFLARTGLDAAEVLQAIVPSLRLAQVGNIELARSADIATNIMKGFRLETSQLEKVVDILALTTTSSNTSVEQLGQGMKFVAPIAAGLGVSLETTSAALGILSDRGLQAGIAGTGLRRVLAELTEPTGKAVKILRLFGLTADDISLSSNTLAESLTTMRDAGIGAEEAIAFFGQRGGPAFEVLVNSIPDIIKFTKELENAGGSAKRIADIMDDTLFGALKKVASAFEAFILALGVTPALQTFFEGLAGAIRSFTANLDTAGVAASSLVLALTVGPILRVVGILTGITAATFTLTGALTIATRAAKLFGRAIAIGFVLEGISLAIDAFQNLGKEIDGITITAAKAGGFAVESFINSIAAGLGTIAVVIGSAVLLAFKPISQAIAETISVGFDLLTDGVDFLLGRDAPAQAVNIGERIGDAFIGSFSTVLSNGFNSIAALFNTRFIKLVDDATFTALTKNPKLEEFLDPFFGSINTATGSFGQGLTPRDKPEVTPIRKGLTETKLAVLDFNDALIDQIRLSTLNRIEQEATAEVLQLAETLRLKNIPLMQQEVEALIQTTIATKRQIEVSELWVETISAITEPLRINTIQQEALNAAFADGDINVSQFTVGIRALRIEMLQLEGRESVLAGLEIGLLQVQDRLTDIGSAASNVVVNSFQSMEDALVNFVTTGKLSFSSLIDSMIADLIRLAVKNAILGIFNFVTGNISGVGGGSGLGPGGSSIVPDFSNSFPPLSFAGTPGADNGGSFLVGGAGGIDQNLLSLNGRPTVRVSRGETVQINPRGGGGRGDVTNIFRIDARGADQGVEEKILEALAEVAPLIVNASVEKAAIDFEERISRRFLG